jgi:uncharacterized C2H2 Zn-finger protein
MSKDSPNRIGQCFIICPDSGALNRHERKQKRDEISKALLYKQKKEKGDRLPKIFYFSSFLLHRGYTFPGNKTQG